MAEFAAGPVGVCLPVTFTSTPSADDQRTAVRRLERAGYHAAWTNEVIGKDALAQLAVLLGATETLAFGTCVANIWARAPQTAHAAAAFLAQAFPARFTLGLGVGYPQQASSVDRPFGTPLATMRSYLDGLAAETQPPAPDAPYPVILGANGPKMLSLAAAHADGALPAGLPPEHTAFARRVLGPDKLLVVAQSIADSAETARQTVSTWLGRAAFRTTLADLGYGTELDDDLVRALVAFGSPDTVAAAVQAHLDAGADHVTLLSPIGTEFGVGIEHLVSLAPALR
ncbi:LLM class flavin-dependent oxidoreductase [Amycolatopsis rhabdoformis]|uniref:LLM class flavin-dependent oxidoreductase n=1 Tax=Amycolatopsis rhabdoformis TaxID=1448059 RepID=A0ABZ1HXQ2_9PSEU|nr:LLM class flavin-dependent oxidoreductase [Amycolatopsis rhabdoformis]WSE26291.1 LLM class flavin-dependent oxidoreductase [Amycolatopsis rhabdoformis]